MSNLEHRRPDGGIKRRLVVTTCEHLIHCGGCPWLAFSENEEQQRKEARLTFMLECLGVEQRSCTFIAAPSRLGYRNRLRLQVDSAGQIQFFNRGKSRNCGAIDAQLALAIHQLRAYASSAESALRPFSHLEVRAPDDCGHPGLFLSYSDGAERSEAAESQLSANLPSFVIGTSRQPIIPAQRFAIVDGTYTFIPLNGFMQVNSTVNRQMVQLVRELLTIAGYRSFLDLYAGAGNFSLPLARANLRGVMADAAQSSVLGAAKAAAEQGISGLECRVADAGDTLRALAAEEQLFDCVILDPPRSGVRTGLEHISSLAQRAILYCSCNMDSLQRDLAALIATALWRVERVWAFNMFPGTLHVETLVWLSRIGGNH